MAVEEMSSTAFFLACIFMELTPYHTSGQWINTNSAFSGSVICRVFSGKGI